LQVAAAARLLTMRPPNRAGVGEGADWHCRLPA